MTHGAFHWIWTKTRDLAGMVADAQLHDLRLLHASDAVMNSESLHAAGRLLGHRKALTTNQYVHLDDATLNQAAERVAKTIRQMLSSSQRHDSIRFNGDASLGKR